MNSIRHSYHVLLVLELCIGRAAYEIPTKWLVILMLNIKVFHTALSAVSRVSFAHLYIKAKVCSFRFMYRQPRFLTTMFSRALLLLSAKVKGLVSMPVKPNTKDIMLVFDFLKRTHAFQKTECSTYEVIFVEPSDRYSS